MNKKQSPSKLWLESKPINAVVQKKHTIRKHGLTWSDPYFWLREKSNPAVMRVLEAENDHFKRELRPLKKTVDRLFRVRANRVGDGDESARKTINGAVDDGVSFLLERPRPVVQSLEGNAVVVHQLAIAGEHCAPVDGLTRAVPRAASVRTRLPVCSAARARRFVNGPVVPVASAAS